MKAGLLSICVGLVVSISAPASASFSATQADHIAKLAREPVWLKLLHFETSKWSSAGPESAIISPSFFLSPNGRTDSAAELFATVSGMFTPPTTEPNQHAQCRFRARYLWLKSKGILSGAPEVNCPDFKLFSSNESVQSISLVLATGYLGNPASYYGHILLKFNSQERDGGTDLLDQSINYGAIVPENVDPVSYILNGVFGGYEGGFSHIQFYVHNHNYGENELRDLWEYQLDLSPQEVSFLTAHAWELIGKKYRYYFFRRNCAYRMGKILELIDGVNVVPNNFVYTIPQAIVQKVGEGNLDGRPLVKDIRYVPSRQSRFYKNYAALEDVEKQTLRSMIEGKRVVDVNSLGDLSLASKHNVLDTAMDYYQFIASQEDDQELNHRYYEALAARYQLPILSTEVSSSFDENASPHRGRKPGLMRLGVLHNSALGDALNFDLRPAYYDALDAGPGHIRHGMLSMADLSLSISPDRVNLRHFDIMSVESVRPSATGLNGDGGVSWKIKAGLERQNLTCNNCLVTRFQADRGYAFALGDNIFYSIYAGGALQENKHRQGNGFGRISMYTTYYADPIRIQAGIEARRHFEGLDREEIVNSLTVRYAFATNYELRMHYEKNVSSEFTLGVGFYW